MATAMRSSKLLPRATLVVFLSLLIRIKGMSTTTPHVTGIEGSSVTLNCNRDADESIGSVIWVFSSDPGIPLPGVEIAFISSDGIFMFNVSPGPQQAWSGEVEASGNSDLVIKRLRLDRDDGYFICSWAVSYISIRVTVQVPVKTVSLLPANNATLSTEQTESTTFTCTVISKPKASVTWEIAMTDTSIVTLSAAVESITTHNKLITVISSLSYRPLKEHNGVSIRCTSQNTANTSPVVSNASRLIIHYPPDSVRAISGYTNPVTESSAESLHLTCSVNGVPNPNTIIYTWSRDCGIGAAGSTSQISIPRNRTMNNKQCYCAVTHSDTGWYQDSPPVTFNIHYHPNSVNPISGYTNPVTESTGSLLLTCSVNGEPNPNRLSYTWSSDCGIGVGSTSQISVPRRRTINNKHCYCTVRHSETGWSQTTRPITFNFIYPPDSVRAISGYRNPVTESNTGSLLLTCSVNGVPNPDRLAYTWSSGCTTGAESTSQQISVPRNRAMNNTHCYCTVTHPETRWRQNSPPVTFNILFGPDTVLITGKTTTTTVQATSNTTILLTCTGSDSNPVASLYWYNTTKGFKSPISPAVSMHPLDGTYGQRSQSIYRIVPSRYDDGQHITCEGQNPRVPDNKQSDYVIFNISYPPILEPAQTRVENQIVVENTQLVLTCTAWAKPLAGITWSSRPTAGIVNTDDDNYRRTSRFTIPSIKRTATGLYRCSANNDHGNIQNQGFNVTVHYVPDVRVSLSSTAVTEGGSTMLECHPSAVPDNYAYIDWTQTVNGVRVREFIGSKVLNLNSLTFEDSGEYNCSVRNIVGTGTGSASVKIKYAPRVVEISNVSAGINGTATLTLTFIGDPQPSVTWYKDGYNSSLNINLMKFSTGIAKAHVIWTFFQKSVTIPGYEATLTIHSVQEQDYTTYHATLDNGLKTATQIPRFSTHLTQHKKPKPASNIRAICDVTTAVVSWVAQYNGGLKQSFHIEYANNGQIMSIVEEDPGEDMEGTAKFIDLHPGRMYTFIIYARNTLGSSETAETMCLTEQVVEEQPRDTGSSINVAAVAAGVTVPLLIIIIVILIVVILVQRRRKSATNKSNKPARNDIVLSDVAGPPPAPAEDGKDVQYEEIHNAYDVIDYEDDGTLHQNTNQKESLAARNDVTSQTRPTSLNTDDGYLSAVPNLTHTASSERSPGADNITAHEYEATSFGDGVVQYKNTRTEATERHYEKLKSEVSTEPSNLNDSAYENKMVNPRIVYDNV